MLNRFFDITFSLIAILMLSPILILVMVILKFSGEGEIFYKQKRVGKDNIDFDLIKFATMLKNSENIGTGTLTVKNDPRVLPFGKFLRKSKINELPQLFNIFMGDMSVIGPRPQTRQSFNYFPEDLKPKLYKMRPGLSGIGSIVFSDEESMLDAHEDPIEFYRTEIAPYKADLELWYKSKQNSLFLYFLLIIITVLVILRLPKRYLFIIFRDLPNPTNAISKYIS